MHCFKCGEHLAKGRDSYTLEELINHKQLRERANDTTTALPSDFTTTIPSRYATWLYKAGINRRTAMDSGIGWSDYHRRIILPIHDSSGSLVYWQGRAVLLGQVPKYINPPVSKEGLLYFAGDHSKLDVVVVTEDVLSAIRVGAHIPSVSILGTSTSDDNAGYLSQYQWVRYWLDPDKAGKAGSAKGARKLSVVTRADVVTSTKDPKNLPNRQIRQLLGLPQSMDYIYHGPVDPSDAQAP